MGIYEKQISVWIILDMMRDKRPVLVAKTNTSQGLQN